jgi:Peptidase inhibitor family I36
MKLRNLAVVACIGAVALAGATAAGATSPGRAHAQAVAPTSITMRNGDLTITFAGPLSVDAYTDCPSGYFCFWGSTSFTGTRYQWTADGWHDLRGFAGPFKSLYNRRSRTAYVHEVDQNQPEFCVDPSERISTMNSAYWHAAWLYLASSQTACG